MQTCSDDHSFRPTIWVALLFVCALQFAVPLVAQQRAPTDLGDMGQAPVGEPTATLHVAVRRVVVDIVVTDAKGKPVRGLAKNDFAVMEDGKPQTMRSFDQHVLEAQQPLPKPQLPPATYSNLSTAPQSGPVTVILYDLLNTPLDAQPYAREQLLEFLKNRKASGQVAIFVLSDRLHMLQGFTDDEDQLIAALNTEKQKYYKSSQLKTADESTQQSDSLARTEGNQNGSDAVKDVSFQAVSAMLKHMEATEDSAMLDQRVQITTTALEEIARFLVGLPGRKNLLWLSGSFSTGILPDASLGGRDSYDVTRNYSTTLVEATDLLNLSHIAVYPVDVRGLKTNPMFDASSNQTYEPGSGKDLTAGRNFQQSNDAEHATMDLIGDQTGGRAFYNTNGLKDAVATAVDEGSVYYTLTYQPTNGKLDGGVRHVKVELTNPALAQGGYKLAYRRTYFADNLDAQIAQSVDQPSDPMAATLEHGAPVAHELFFEAHLQTYGQPTAATPAQMEVLAKYAALANGNKKSAARLQDRKPVQMQRYLIEYGLLLRQLQLTLSADGTHRGNLQFAVMSYDSDGKALNGIRSSIQDSIPTDRYQRLMESGYPVIQTVAVPVQAVSLRLAVRDVGTNRMGSLEIPLPVPPTVAATPPSGSAAPKSP